MGRCWIQAWRLRLSLCLHGKVKHSTRVKGGLEIRIVLCHVVQVASLNDLKRFLFFASFSRTKEAKISWSPEMESMGAVLVGEPVGLCWT